MSTRFDNRSVSTFKKDIYFATKLEKYFFTEWLGKVESRWCGLHITGWDDNGCGNDGEFIAKGNTAGADYKISGSVKVDKEQTLMYNGMALEANLEDEPLEIKWVPTAGKFTLKENDLKAYIKEQASILFIYNSVRCGTDLRKPKDYDFDRHIKLVESKSQQIKWGIMWSSKVKELYEKTKEDAGFKPIHYMGGKYGVVLKQEDFSKWFVSHDWE